MHIKHKRKKFEHKKTTQFQTNKTNKTNLTYVIIHEGFSAHLRTTQKCRLVNVDVSVFVRCLSRDDTTQEKKNCGGVGEWDDVWKMQTREGWDGTAGTKYPVRGL